MVFDVLYFGHSFGPSGRLRSQRTGSRLLGPFVKAALAADLITDAPNAPKVVLKSQDMGSLSKHSKHIDPDSTCEHAGVACLRTLECNDTQKYANLIDTLTKRTNVVYMLLFLEF